MVKQRTGALIAFLVGVGFVGVELAFGIRTGLAGLFVTGMAGGLLVGDVMQRTSNQAR